MTMPKTPASAPNVVAFPKVAPAPRARYFVGSLFRLKVPCLGNPPGTRGVVYEVYRRDWADDDGAIGYSLLFPNGRYDGFSAREVKQFLDYAGECADPQVRHYRFVNVLALEHAVQRGLFRPAFTAGA